MPKKLPDLTKQSLLSDEEILLLFLAKSKDLGVEPNDLTFEKFRNMCYTYCNNRTIRLVAVVRATAVDSRCDFIRVLLQIDK